MSSLTELLTSGETYYRPVSTEHPTISAPVKLMLLTPHHIPLLCGLTNLFIFFVSNLNCFACQQHIFLTLLYQVNITK